MAVSAEAPRARATFWDRQWRAGGMGTNLVFSSFLPRDELGGKQVLDVGCGNSDITGASRIARHYVGLDIAKEAAKQLRAEFNSSDKFYRERPSLLREGSGLPATKDVVVADASALDMIKTGSFDAVLSSDTLTPAGELALKILQNMARISRNLVIFFVSHTEIAKNVSDAKSIDFEDGTLFLEPDISRWCLDETGLAKVLARVGLVPRKVVTFTENDIDSYYGSQFSPFIPTAEGEARSRIYVEAIKPHHPDIRILES